MQEIPKGLKIYFTKELMRWHHTENSRSLPWKGEKDPYKIWLSEIILQQTRAQQGLPYYERYIHEYPTIQKMAAADDELIFRLWQGLGYYNRCRNMLATARFITNELDGVFPSKYEDIIQLKGVGNYTAAAIASFAYGLPHAVVDGNVYRVLSRFFNTPIPYDTVQGKKEFQALAQELLDEKDSAGYNQAIMDLGATVCTPQNPQCSACQLSDKCIAYKLGIVNELPVKSKKTQVKTRYFSYLIFDDGTSIWVEKRTGKDIWQNLYQPYLVESKEELTIDNIKSEPLISKHKKLINSIQSSLQLSQRLTHRLIRTNFYIITVKQQFLMPDTQGEWVTYENLKNYAFPKSLVSFFEKKLYF